MATISMKFTTGDYDITLSEAGSDKKVTVSAYQKGSHVAQIYLNEENLISLRKWVNKQLLSINSSTNKK